jgi:hypothetical protein
MKEEGEGEVNLFSQCEGAVEARLNHRQTLVHDGVPIIEKVAGLKLAHRSLGHT